MLRIGWWWPEAPARPTSSGVTVAGSNDKMSGRPPAMARKPGYSLAGVPMSAWESIHTIARSSPWPRRTNSNGSSEPSAGTLDVPARRVPHPADRRATLVELLPDAAAPELPELVGVPPGAASRRRGADGPRAGWTHYVPAARGARCRAATAAMRARRDARPSGDRQS